MTVPGHLFITRGDVTSLACDAWLLPTDTTFQVTRSFGASVGLEGGGRLDLEWGGKLVLRFEPERDQSPQIWLGNIGREEAEPDKVTATVNHLLEVVRQFVDAASNAIAAPVGRPRLLAVNAVGTGHGGASGFKGNVFRALVERLMWIAETTGNDLVLVCFDEAGYAAAQRLRRNFVSAQGDLHGLWPLDSARGDLFRTADALADRARAGQLVQFIGAGVSAGAGLPTWRRLLEEVGRELGESDAFMGEIQALDFRDQATLLDLKLNDSGGLRPAVARHLAVDRYSLGHSLLASIGCTETVTTNYDEMIELAVGRDPDKDAPPRLAVLPDRPDRRAPRWLLKLHGTVSRAESIVITREHYHDMATSNGALLGLVQALLLTKHMLFVGYSLTDEDFHQLLHEVRLAMRGANEREVFGTVLTLFDSPTFERLWESDLQVIAMAPAPKDPRRPTNEELEAAVRQLLIFLDLLAHQAADVDSYLLDPSYDELLDSDERRLRWRIKDLKRVLATDVSRHGPLRQTLDRYPTGTEREDGEERRTGSIRS